jgi:hypothetical protein
MINPEKFPLKNKKRTFCFTPSEVGDKWAAGSMCVEAAASFSLFLVFMANVFSLIFLFGVYADDMTALQQKGKEMAAYSSWTGVEADGLITLKDVSSVSSPLPLLAAPLCRIYSQCVVKPWTGYCATVDLGSDEEMVYVTEYGQVYHKNRSCSHLALSLRVCAYNQISEERNQSGAKYYPCEYCGKNGFVTVVYLTGQGNRYHTSLYCKGLKRTLRYLPLSQVGSLPACKTCGG